VSSGSHTLLLSQLRSRIDRSATRRAIGFSFRRRLPRGVTEKSRQLSILADLRPSCSGIDYSFRRGSYESILRILFKILPGQHGMSPFRKWFICTCQSLRKPRISLDGEPSPIYDNYATTMMASQVNSESQANKGRSSMEGVPVMVREAEIRTGRLMRRIIPISHYCAAACRRVERAKQSQFGRGPNLC